MTATQEEVMAKRRKAVVGAGYKVLETYPCEATGGATILAKNQWNKSEEMKAFFFKPRALNRSFKTESVTSHHQRAALPGRLAKILQAEKDAKVAPHDLVVGEVMACIWGVTMQDVRFYKVVGIPAPRKVTVVPIDKKMVSGDWMAGQAMPVDDGITGGGSEQTYVVDMSSGRPYCKTGSSIERMTRWDGKPVSIYSD